MIIPSSIDKKGIELKQSRRFTPRNVRLFIAGFLLAFTPFLIPGVIFPIASSLIHYDKFINTETLFVLSLCTLLSFAIGTFVLVTAIIESRNSENRPLSFGALLGMASYIVPYLIYFASIYVRFPY